jgi:DNA repair protein RadC
MLLKLKRKYKKKPMILAMDVYFIMREILLSLDPVEKNKEYFWVMGLSTSNHVKYIDVVSIGSLGGTIAEPREIFTYAIRFGGISKIILIHSHPSGNLKPSHADKSLTHQMIEAGKILRIEVLDHLIITQKSFYSFLGQQHEEEEK